MRISPDVRLAITVSCTVACYALMQMPTYEIQHTYRVTNEVDGLPIHRILFSLDPVSYPSLSQAKKVVEFGSVLVVSSDAFIADVYSGMDSNTMNSAPVANSTTTARHNETLVLRSRLPDAHYPQSWTKYVDPPLNFETIRRCKSPILFEDDTIAIVNKPEGIDTIGEKRYDLQSALPFILHPPKISKQNKQQTDQYLPRPIHRLDRATSGCVLVAKSKQSMKHYSSLFAKRQIHKTYCAIVFGEPVMNPDSIPGDEEIQDYSTIDYPIDGKSAISLWKSLATVTSPTWGRISLLHIIPLTGRYHQIRRHLSYCLSTPILGDPKYDGGGELAKRSRELGLFLCSNSIQVERHTKQNDSVNDISVSIPLPDKFYEILGLKRNDIISNTITY